jgi:hypothetical protein
MPKPRRTQDEQERRTADQRGEHAHRHATHTEVKRLPRHISGNEHERSRHDAAEHERPMPRPEEEPRQVRRHEPDECDRSA